MIKSEMLLNIITTDTIQNMGVEKIDHIKEEGAKRRHLVADRYSYLHCYNLATAFGKKKILEFMNSSNLKELSKDEKLLFASELRFDDENSITTVLDTYNISKEEILELNELIKNCQSSYIEYTLGLVKLEKKFELTFEQVKEIVKLYPAIINSNYQLNEEDKKLYNNVQKFMLLLSVLDKKRNKFISLLNQNNTMIKLVSIGQNHYNLTPDLCFLLINKINHIMAITPAKIKSKNK